MHPDQYWSSRLISFVLGLTLFASVSANAQELPRSVTVASNPPGTVFYALASGLAKVASEGTPFQMVVQPYSGTSTFLPLLNTVRSISASTTRWTWHSRIRGPSG
jgi:TRAP-type uncharacterized transport system substrate-binding protein